MKKIFLTLTISLISISLFPQSNNISQFAIWKPKEGLEQKFEAGYKQHLLWHKANADKWSWFGWYVISGPRYGPFVDATFDHSWSDFDNPVSPADDRVDNNLHVFPFGEIQSVFKVSKFLELSVSDATGENSKLIRLITISTIDFINAIEVISKLKARYTFNGLTKIFLTYKIVDGGGGR